MGFEPVQQAQFRVIHSNAVQFDNAQERLWKIVTAPKRPSFPLSIRAAFRLDIEASRSVPEINAERRFLLPEHVQLSDSSLAQTLAQIMAQMSDETNIKLGIRLDENGRFRLMFPLNGRAVMKYTLSRELALRLQLPEHSSSNDVQTNAAVVRQEEVTPEEEVVAADVLANRVIEAHNIGNIHVCVLAGRDSPYMPSTHLATLKPNACGAFEHVDMSSFLTTPLVGDGRLLQSLADGYLRLQFYTQALDSTYVPYTPKTNMRFEGGLVYRMPTK